MADVNPSFKELLQNPIHFLAFGFGSGLAPVAPGTFGTLASVPLFCLMAQFNVWIYIAITLAVCAVGIHICGKTAQDLGVHDHGGIVWDEFAGFFITMLPIQLVGPIDSLHFWVITAVGFAVFRLFDALKPWPISWLDKNLDGGMGIMLDDLLAGFFSLLVVQACLYGGL